MRVAVERERLDARGDGMPGRVGSGLLDADDAERKPYDAEEAGR